ncbi:hypothetical protein, partial [Klebsiella pneumoniae]|uniref:hypothetical protein n=1 Tax=Klebsiella pneumoniae TaxID=573 RepID=UPI0021D69DCE
RHGNPYLIIHAGHLNLAQGGHYNFAVTKLVRVIIVMLNLIINDIKINILRQWPTTFPLQQPVMEALETESSHEFVMP